MVTNTERIQANNAELREAIQMAESLPNGSSVETCDITFILHYDYDTTLLTYTAVESGEIVTKYVDWNGFEYDHDGSSPVLMVTLRNVMKNSIVQVSEFVPLAFTCENAEAEAISEHLAEYGFYNYHIKVLGDSVVNALEGFTPFATVQDYSAALREMGVDV